MNSDNDTPKGEGQWKTPILVAGFDGWGNALNLSKGMTTFLIQSLDVQPFARIDPDEYYRYDGDRPFVEIESGNLDRISFPGGVFYTVQSGSLAGKLCIFEADEPSLKWIQFAEEILSICESQGVETIVTLGSMYDQVLHTDRIISGVTSGQKLMDGLRANSVNAIGYSGPTAIHSIIHSLGQQRGLDSISLWCHCPYYLQGVMHFGLLSRLAEVLMSLGGFKIDTADLATGWEKLQEKLQALIESKPELQAAIEEIQKQKMEGTVASRKAALRKGDKVINLQDFWDQKPPK